MTRILTAGLLIGTLTAFSSCMKNEVRDIPPPVTEVPAGYLARVEWDNGMKGYFDYNGGVNTLKSIQYIFGGSTGKTVFEWSGSRLSSIADDGSQFKTVYNYAPDNKLSSTKQMLKSGSGDGSYLLEYTYNPDATVDSLKYYTISGSVKTLMSQSGYIYDTAGDLSEVVTETSNGTIRSIIESYSAELLVAPEMYLDVVLSDSYMIYNLPVLSQNNKLPTKITRMVKAGAGSFTTDKIQEVEFTLAAKKVLKTKTTITYPTLPGSNTVVVANYVYQP
ncbi:MAG: hypothetical protein ABWZ25_16620 [Chitinophagaceae bacterium]